jgi:hypothetical protein
VWTERWECGGSGSVGAQESEGSQKDWCGGRSVAFGRFCGASAAAVRVAFGRERRALARSQAARPRSLADAQWSTARVTNSPCKSNSRKPHTDS